MVSPFSRMLEIIMMLGSSARIALGKELRRPRQRRDLAEIAGDPDQVLLREALAAEQQHAVVEPGLMDRLDGLGIELVAQVDAADFGADMLASAEPRRAGRASRCSWRNLEGEPEWTRAYPSDPAAATGHGSPAPRPLA